MPSFIAREGYSIIMTVLAVAAALLFFSFITDARFAFPLQILASAVFLFFVFTLFFFRDPERKTGLNPSALIAPADGTIIAVKEMNEPRYLKGGSTRISIFMSVFNVHVNRSPINGLIELVHYNPGKFISAFKEKASEDNESLLVGIQGQESYKKIAVKFIAGLIARRIVFYKKLNDTISQGERINLIRFGSRVDLYCPRGTEIKVKNGDKVTAGETVIALFKNP